MRKVLRALLHLTPAPLPVLFEPVPRHRIYVRPLGGWARVCLADRVRRIEDDVHEKIKSGSGGAEVTSNGRGHRFVGSEGCLRDVRALADTVRRGAHHEARHDEDAEAAIGGVGKHFLHRRSFCRTKGGRKIIFAGRLVDFHQCVVQLREPAAIFQCHLHLEVANCCIAIGVAREYQMRRLARLDARLL